MNSPCELSDLLVFSHMRWDFIFHRPHHVMTRFAEHRRVFYFEESIFGMTEIPRLHLKITDENIHVVVPYLPMGMDSLKTDEAMRELLSELIVDEEIKNFTAWYYSPTALNFSRHLNPVVRVFDCLPSAHQSAMGQESEMIKAADLVFTDGEHLHHSLRKLHLNIHSFPNSLDVKHFSRSRLSLAEPEDQINIPHPRIGFYGVIDEKFNAQLLGDMADLRAEFHFILIGPLMGRDLASLPQRSNIHYLGKKDYSILPLYLAGWDCSIIPLQVNDRLKSLGSAKAAECLAAGKPVVSTSIPEVQAYTSSKLIYIADCTSKFVESIEAAIHESVNDSEWIERVDNFLEGSSWDQTFLDMAQQEMILRDNDKESRTSVKVPAYLDRSLMEIGIV